MTEKKSTDLNDRLDTYRNVFRRESGERLKQERGRLGLSQVEFAKQAGIHRNTQAKYEAGERDPDDSYYKTIAELGVSIPYVIDGDRFDAVPGPASYLTREIFEDAYHLGLTKLYPEAIARLVYLVTSSYAHWSSEFDGTLEDNQRSALITAAFKRGEEFAEAAIAISKYGSRITGERPSPTDEAALILETLDYYDANRDKLHLNIRDNIRLMADDLVEVRAQEKGKK